jgi:hypothetical protein
VFYGICDCRKQFLVYQISGLSSSSNVPEWRRVNVDEINLARGTSQIFAGPRRPFHPVSIAILIHFWLLCHIEMR